MKPNRLALIIALLAVAAAAIVLTPLLAPNSRLGQEWRPKLGLDIRGGMRVVLEAETDKLPQGQEWDQDARSAVLNILRNRVDASGVSEPAIAPKGERQFVVELPNIRNEAQVLQLLQNTARLEFYYSPDWKTQRNQLGRYDIQREDTAGGREQYRIVDLTTRAEFRDPFHINLALSELIERGQGAGENPTRVPLPDALRTLPAAAGLEAVTVPAKDAPQIAALAEEKENFDRFLQGARLELTGNDLLPNARGNLSALGQPEVLLEFNAEGRRKFANFTRDHTNEILMIYLDGQILMAPNINEPILHGNAQISPFPSLREAQQLADYLNGGALPVPLQIVQQQSIQATLGQEAVERGLLAGVVGLGAVLLFMAGYYLLPGAVACVALLLYTLFVYAVFLMIPVTFTLPGIAGFILSIGMAIDANVLIFERTKEELRAGRSLRAAIETGFQRAFSAIVDSNVCTAITSLLLYNFGTGPVRGFALTLLIGVAISMFTAITVTRTILLLLVNTRVGKNLNAWGIHRTYVPRLNVIGRRNAYFALSALLIVPGLIYAFLGGIKPGIDFSGGSEMTLQFNRPVTRTEVERAVAAQGIPDPVAQIAEDNLVFVRTPEITRQQADTATAALNTQFEGVTRESFEVIGAAISTELTRNAFLAILFSSILIVLYLAMRFAIGGFVNGIKFGVCAILTMLHDVGILIGSFAILGYFFNWKVDTLFVTALLTVIGYSVHDTIVIFDRIRENLRHRARGESFEDLVNKSINETFTRSMNTSWTVIFTLAALLVFAGPVIRPLNAALLIGIIAGTYSSIFNAAPFLVVWERRAGRKGTISPVAGGPVRGGQQPAPAGPGGRTPIPPLTPSPPAPDRTTGDGRAGDGRAGDRAGNGTEPGSDRTYSPRPRPSTPPGPRRKRRM